VERFRVNQRTSVLLCLALSVTLAAASAASAQTVAPDVNYSADKWHVATSPYLWFAGMNGSIGFDSYSVKINQSFTDIFSNLKFGVMDLTEVNRGPVSLLTDVMYIRLGNESAVPIQGLPSAINVNATLNTFTLTQYLGYRLLGRKRGFIQMLSGVRYYHDGASINASYPNIGSVSHSVSDNWADYVEGARFDFHATQRMNLFFLGDVGTGGSVFTYQYAGGAGYTWGKSMKWTTSLGYRRLYFHRQTGNGVNVEPTEQGLFAGVTYRFR
jgi:hypothetical protein